MFCYSNSLVQEDLESLSRLDFTPYRDSRILITGLTGMLATYLAFAFLYCNERLGLNTKVTGLVRNRVKAESRFKELLGRPDFDLMVQDVTDPIEGEFDVIFHLAGSASAAAILNSPEGIIRANVVGTGNVLELAARNSARVFFASTREVYGSTGETILTEETLGVLDQLNTRSCYPESKRMAENLCAVYGDRYGLNICIGRIAHSYGPGMQLKEDGRIMADLISNGVSGEDIVLKSDGTARRAFCYITDAVSAILLTTGKREGLSVYNIANETQELSIRELAELVASLSRNSRVVFHLPEQSEKKAYFSVPRVRLSTEKLESLGWKPMVSLEEGVRRTLEAMQ